MEPFRAQERSISKRARISDDLSAPLSSLDPADSTMPVSDHGVPIDVSEKKLRSVLWVTNLAAPYRVPVWRHLSKKHVLSVALLESNAGLQRDSNANRGRDWLHSRSGDIAYSELPSWKIRRGESRYYMLKSPRSLLAVKNFDAVLFGGWESPAYWSLLAACRAFRVPCVGFYESPRNTMTYRSGVVAWIRSKFFRSMDTVVVPGKAAAEAVESMGVEPARIRQGFNAVDVAQFQRAAVRTSPDDSAAAGTGHRYLYVGRLIHLKRVNSIIEAFIQIAGEDDELTIVGAGSLRQNLHALAGQSERKIRFLEHVENSEMPAVMAQHHTLVLASEREVWGLVVNEALASGMHVVVTENCGVVPSVSSMRGVHVVKSNLIDLSRQMEISKSEWTDRIYEPEILQYTPERFAEVFASAFAASFNTHGSHESKFAEKNGLR